MSRAATFADVTNSVEVQELLEATYGGDIELLDAFTGALAEGSDSSSHGVLGDLLTARG